MVTWMVFILITQCRAVIHAPQALKRTEIYIPEQKNVERVNYLLISVIIVFVGLVIYKIK